MQIFGYIIVGTLILTGLAGPINPFPDYGMWAHFGAAVALVGFFAYETLQDALSSRRLRLQREAEEKVRREWTEQVTAIHR